MVCKMAKKKTKQQITDEVFLVLSILLVILNIGDIWSTYLLLNSGGFEMNPLAAWIFANFGFFVGGIIWKVAGVVITLKLVYMSKKHNTIIAACVLSIIVGMLAMTVISNFGSYLYMINGVPK